MKKPGIVILLVLSFIVTSVNNFTPRKNIFTPGDSLSTAVIAVTGDIMCHSVQFKYAHVAGDSFDFNPVFRYVKDIISSADFAFGNLETVTAGKENTYSGYPFFNSPDYFITALANAGFDLLTTANNHALDRGEEGVRRTIKKITENGLAYNGTFLSREDRDSVRIFNIKGINIVFLAYSYGTNGLPVPKGKDYIINLIDTNLIRYDIEAAEKLHPDIILVHYHFGEEYQREPSEFQKEIVKKTAAYGADIIIGGHPHVIQPAEYIMRGTDSIFVIYSMGNFLSNQQWRYSDAGVVLKLSLQKNFTRGKTSIIKVSADPVWVYKGRTDKGYEYVIIPENNSETYPAFIKIPDKMKQAFYDTRLMLQGYINFN